MANKASQKISHLGYAIIQSFGATACLAPFLFFLHRPANINIALLILFYIWFVSMVISSVGALLRRSGDTLSSDTRSAEVLTHNPELKRAKIYGRLQPKLRSADIYALSAEDHYVRVFTAAGQDMILMRLSDAITETEPLRGVQTHRSWWVAETGVESAKRKDGKILLTLKSDQIVPVSRSGAKLVKEAGWV